jgi:hypothetical protein
MRTYFVLPVILTAVFSILSMPETVSAQLPPPISPWMGMFQSSRGNPFGNYQTYVKPQMDMMSEFRSQGQAIQKQAVQQAAQGKQLEGATDKVLDMPRKRPPIGGQPACGFGQHLHFYPNIGASPVPNYSTPQVGGKVRR